MNLIRHYWIDSKPPLLLFGGWRNNKKNIFTVVGQATVFGKPKSK
jgi:hypothetical protein